MRRRGGLIALPLLCSCVTPCTQSDQTLRLKNGYDDAATFELGPESIGPLEPGEASETFSLTELQSDTLFVDVGGEMFEVDVADTWNDVAEGSFDYELTVDACDKSVDLTPCVDLDEI